MANENIIRYKSHQRRSTLPSCVVDFEFFKKLFKVLQEATVKAAEIDIAQLKKAPDQTDEQFESLKNYARSLYEVTIMIFGIKGEYITSNSSAIFDGSDLPDRIATIVFDNSIQLNFALKKEPRNKARIEFDFRKQPITNLFPNPSLATQNSSCVNIFGEDETWVAGVHKNISDLLEKHKTKRSWLHKNFIYDISLLFLLFPITFWSLFRIDSLFAISSWNVSRFLIIALYIYIFILILHIYRFVFLKIRETFPSVELVTPQQKIAVLHKLAWIGVFATIVTPIIIDIIKFFAR